MKTLMHICCAPCANRPIEVLRTDGFEVTGFWYNPNIHPVTEYTFSILSPRSQLHFDTTWHHHTFRQFLTLLPQSMDSVQKNARQEIPPCVHRF